MSSSRSTPWQQLWDEAQPRLKSIQTTLATGAAPNARITRVGQLDAELLDQELVQILQEPLNKALGVLNDAFRGNFQAELTLLIRLVLYKFSVWDLNASYGARLQGLKYVSHKSSGLSSRTLLLHCSLTILIPYIHDRVRAHALSRAWPDAPSSDRRRKVWDFLMTLESTHSLLALLNFVIFLWNGRFRTLSDRLLNLSLVSSRRLTQREVSYEFMNRQMVWHAFTEFLLFLLPLINARALGRRLRRSLPQLSAKSLLPSFTHSMFGIYPEPESSASRKKRGKYWSLPLDQCAICHEDAAFRLNLPSTTSGSHTLPAYATSLGEPPLHTENTEEEPPLYPIHTPYVTSCDHMYCYVCLTERMLRTADEMSGIGPGGKRWECLRCGDGVTVADRFEVAIEETESEFGSGSGGGVDFEGYGSDDMEFTDTSGSMGSYSESGTASD